MAKAKNPDPPIDEPEEDSPDKEGDNDGGDDEEKPDEDLLGVYEGFDWTDQPFVKLSEKARNHMIELCRNCAKRDMASRRMEVEQAWEAELFDRGYHFLFPRRGGGWQLNSMVSGKTWSQMQGSQVHETNVYGAFNEIVTAALVRDIPTGRFEPEDPNSDPDVTAAEKAEDYKELFAKNNNLKEVHTQAANYMCTDGRVLFYTTYRLDGQRFGFDSERDETAVSPETEANATESKPGKPRGRELVEVYGKLYHKVPIQARSIHDMDFVQLHYEVDISCAKAKFPWIEDKIQPGGGSIQSGVGEIGIDRIARINVQLALEGGYVTADSFNRDVTISYCWLRPASFYHVKDKEVRKEFFKNFPDGSLAVYAGDELAFCRNECMDDHLHILQALPGNGQNRRGLMSSVLSIQKRLNNWIDLLNDFFTRCVPTLWMDGEVFDVANLSKVNNVPGQRRPFLSVPGRQVGEMIYAEPLPTHQPEFPGFIQLFFQDFPQMLSGALPSLFGAESNTDTVGGISIQRDQALARLGTPWSRLQNAAACYLRQAVMLAAKCRLARGEKQISWLTDDSRKMVMEVADLKGSVLCYPEEDANFPESWIQRSSRFQQLMVEAPNNPLVQQIMTIPENMRVARDALGMKEIVIPAADSVDKQRGEFEVLLKTRPAPMPNPQLDQVQQQLQQIEQQAMSEGPEAYAQFQQMMPQLQQQIQSIPPLISSCPVAQDASENHQVEAAVCVSMMNSPIGRRLKSGTPEEQQAFQNLHLHWQEHTKMAQQLNPPQPNQRPVSNSISVAVDKMPNPVASQLLQQYYNLPAQEQDFNMQDAQETEQDLTQKAADFGRGARPAAPQQPQAPVGVQ